MPLKLFPQSTLLILTLSACGGSGLAPINTDGATLNAGDTTVTLTTDALDTTLPLNPDLDRGPFTGASDLNDDGEGQILASSEGETTFAAFLLNRETGNASDSFYGQTAAPGTLPTGQATLSGTFVGAFINPVEDPLRSYIEGDAALVVDLDEMTIGGGVTNMTSKVNDVGIDLPLNVAYDIVFPEAEILEDGTFAGLEERTQENVNGGNDALITTDWSGLLSGETLSDMEAVGKVDAIREVEGINGVSYYKITTHISGVFAAGHE